ncbi:antibiotic biosynthesis monooxygenase [Kocuria sp. JC486]|uniref:antibiotic biosynthesis monooxygenase n=1 Tax=Kocuria sp. JC486 TaxID=1970736 RepID=UPI00141DE02C|nr:antibiotic biosynthesis monooxygenase [Kocuria sp. JC486]
MSLTDFHPPYTAVIFTSTLAGNAPGYEEMAARMEMLVIDQPGYLGHESARTPGGLGITVSYWRTAQDAQAWKGNHEHLLAQSAGSRTWYSDYSVRIAVVERQYDRSTSPH